MTSSQGGSVTAGRPAVVTYPPAATVGPRAHGRFEFLWLMTGTVEWNWLDGDKQVLIEPGTLLLARPHMHEHFQWNRYGTTTHGYVHFDITPAPDPVEWPLTRPATAPGPIGGMLDYLLWLAEEPAADWRAHVEQTIDHLLEVFLSAPLPDPGSTTEPLVLAAALDHVRRAWEQGTRPITLAELANAASVSKEHVSRLFRQYFGTGVIKALELVRLSQAETLLTRSNLSITQIGDSCGYRDSLHFSRRFSAIYGMSPRQYRQHGTHQSPLIAAGLLPLAHRVTGRSST